MTTTAPRAIRHFGLAAMEARARHTREVSAGPSRPVAVQPFDRQPRRRVVVRLWLPLTPLFVLLAPFPILLIPFCYLAPPLRGVNCAAAIFAIGDALLALGGTSVHVDTPEALVRIKIF